MDELEGMAERLMEFPRAISKQVQMNCTTIVALINQQENLLKLIAGLHDIDLDALRKEIGV